MCIRDSTNSNIIDGNKWYHATFVKSSTAGMSVYINGILVATNTTATAAVNNNVTSGGKNTIAYYKTTASSGYFDGRIGQFRAYSTTLTQAQIRANYDATRTLYQGVGTTANVLQTGLLNNIDVDSYSSYDPNSFGIANKAAKFSSSSSSFINTTIPGSIFNTDTFSISFWYKRTTSNQFEYILGTADTGILNGFAIGVYNSSGGMRFDIITRNGSGTVGRYQGGAAVVNVWTHLVMSVSSNSWTFYQDGALMRDHTGYSQPMAGNTYNNSNNLYLGRAGLYATETLNESSVGQTRIFSSALTADQVKILYNETSATTGTLNPTGLSNCVALYNFDSDSGTTVDLSLIHI